MATAVRKILRNESGGDLIIFNKIVPDEESYEVPQRYWADAPTDAELLAAISIGDVVVNDGTSDLSAANGLLWVVRWQLDHASDIPFDNSSNGFTATKTQAAIEEIRTSPVGVLDTYVFSELGIAANEWLEYGGSSIKSNETFAILPFSAKLIACTFSCDDGGSDTDIEVHKAPVGSGGSAAKVATFEVRNRRVARFSDFTHVQFNAGDKFSVYMNDQGTNASNVVVKLYFLVSEFNRVNAGEDFDSNFNLSIGGITITIG